MFRRSHTAGAKSATSRPEVKRAVERLVEEFKPDSIYLFGSFAEGHSRPESSIDILIVSPHVGSVRFLERIKRAMKVTIDDLPTIAPLVYTPDEVELLKSQGDGFMADVLKHSKRLYEKK